MNISLETLIKIGACREAQRAFVDKFGRNSEATAKEIFEALTEGQRSDWLFWLAARLDGFVQAVGDFSSGNFYCAISGKIDVATGFVIATGSATVEAYGSATVEAYGSATVRATGSATVRATGSATVRAYGSATVRAYDSATVEAYDSATVRAYDSATVRATGSATVEAYGSATVRAYDSATVRAYDSATVRAYDSATVLLTRYSLNVSLEIKSDNACAVDRRNSPPRLITQIAE